MAPELTEDDRERFAALRERLADVDRVERVAKRPPSPGPIEPMLATTLSGSLDAIPEDEFIAEQKFDGTRLIAETFDGATSLYTRRHVERSETLPDLARDLEATLGDGVILDGEYTFLTPEGTSRFVPIHTGEATIESEDLTGQLFVFDVLAVDGEWTTRLPLTERKALLEEMVTETDEIRLVEYHTEGFQAVYDDVVAAGEEGIMLKRRSSSYHVGTRSAHWQKVKAFTERDVVIVGYTTGMGRRAGTFGALVMTDGERYIGKVGSGFDDEELASLIESMDPVAARAIPVSDVGESYVPVAPFVARVKYQAVTDSGDLRAPVFLRRRPGKPLEDVSPLE